VSSPPRGLVPRTRADYEVCDARRGALAGS